MGEPQRFYSSRALDMVPQGNTPPDDKSHQKPIIGDNPTNAFETYHVQVQTDLRGWMTFSPESRMAKVKWYQDTTKQPDMDKRCKILNYIIWLESHHPLGDSQVAAIAFRGLFPKHIPKGAKVADAST